MLYIYCLALIKCIIYKNKNKYDKKLITWMIDFTKQNKIHNIAEKISTKNQYALCAKFK